MQSASRIETIFSPGEGFELENYVGDITAMVGHTQERPVLLGYSHTAFFVVHYAIANPDKLSALILIEPALFNDREELLSRAHKALSGDEAGSIQELLQKIQPDLADDPNLARAYTKYVVRATDGPNAIGMELLARANHPISAEQLASLKIPVLLIGGTKSHAAYTIHRSLESLPNAFVWWVQDATHMDIMGKPHSEKVSIGINAFYAVHGFDKTKMKV